MKLLPGWINRDLGLLFAGRAIRSLEQSYLAILVPIYVAKLDFDALRVGYLLPLPPLRALRLPRR